VGRIHLRTPTKRWTAAEWARWCVKYHRRRRHDDALQLIWAEFCERPYRGIRRVRRSGSILGATPLKLHVATLTNPASGKPLPLTRTRRAAARTVFRIWPGMCGSGLKAFGRMETIGVWFGAGRGTSIMASLPAPVAPTSVTRTAAASTSGFVAPEPSFTLFPVSFYTFHSFWRCVGSVADARENFLEANPQLRRDARGATASR